MAKTDLNLLSTLDVLLTEASVARAARRLRLSPSAMSRALARLREATGDPLLVRAGRHLVLTTRALELRERVGQVVQDAEAVLRWAEKLDLATLERSFTLRTSEGFVENFGPQLITRIQREAPGVRLHFLQKLDKDSAPLREGLVDLETGVMGATTGPELRTQALFRDHFVGVVREGHPFCHGELDAARFAAGQHVAVARRSNGHHPVDEALAALGLARRVVASVSGFALALFLARTTDLVATVPARHTGVLRAGLFTFALPVATPEITVSLFWHPRLQADPAHRWLRECVREICAQSLARSSADAV